MFIRIDAKHRLGQKKLKPFGITEVFTSEKPGLGAEDLGFRHIIFSSPLNANTAYYYCNDEHMKKLLSLGIIFTQGNIINLLVRGDHKILKAIEVFCNIPFYNNIMNHTLITHLEEYKRKSVLKKKTRQPPTGSKLESDFVKTDEIVETESLLIEQKSFNETYIVRKKQNEKKKFVFKLNFSKRVLSELEAYNAACYRLLLGKNHHPKVYSVHNTKNERVAIISKWVEGFQTMLAPSGYSTKKAYTELLIASRAIKVWTAAYIREESDLNDTNYGICKNGYCVKVDDGHSAWPISSMFNFTHPKNGISSTSIPPAEAFPVTQSDIRTLPRLKYAHPIRFPDRNRHPLIDLDALIQNEKVQEDKYYIFLKEILLSKKEYEAISIVTISSPRIRRKSVKRDCKKIDALREALLGMPEFKQYLEKNTGVINEIINDFNVYNLEFKKEEQQALRINTADIQQRFNSLYSEIMSLDNENINNLKNHGFFPPEQANPSPQMPAETNEISY